MPKVILRASEPIKDALRRFKKMCDREGIVNRFKRTRRFEKPSVKRRRENAERIKTIRKGQRMSR